jgi:hypothetical protein
MALLPKTMKLAALNEAALVSLKFAKDPLVEETDVCTGKELLSKSGTVGSLVFVVRRPG